ncbi:MAG: CHASE domain-containing protein [Sulfuricurvum sp.]|uniref:CHASE domain-containing protein n=1 Tax=Sulfuricurvum sp. TaxID=2025608 RepID=UPI0025FA3CF4|nr:CHASE domain-containing protein [Sulfuricurvum sp.]MBV5321588.1 CHASE domain-containing protein [Sulfuricurvum sp.]
MNNHFKTYFSDKIGNSEFVNSRIFSMISMSFSLILLLVVWYFSENLFYNRAQAKFDHHVNHEHISLQNRLQEYENTLRGGVGFLKSSENVTRSDWHNYIKSINIENYYPGIQGIGYSIVIPPDNLQSFEDKIQRAGYPSFELKPKGDRQYYTAILYLEPLDRRNQAAIGFDMFSEPVRREAMQRARDSGNMALSGKVTLMQEIDKDVQVGVLMYLPYYAEESEVNTVEQRQKLLLGYVYAPFRMGDLINANVTHKDTLMIEVYDVEKKEEANLLYKSPNPSDYHSDYSTHRTINMGGRIWHLHYKSSPEFDALYNSFYPIAFALIGLIFYFMMIYIIVELLKKRALLKSQTKEIDKNRSWLDTLLKSSVDGIHILDFKGKLIEFSPSFLQMLGYTGSEANLLSVFDWEAKNSKQDIQMKMESLIQSPMTFETCFCRKDGSIFDVEVTARAIVDKGEKYLYASARDISERKASEQNLKETREKLEESEAFYRTIFGSVDVSIVILVDNRVIDCNNLALNLFNITKEEFIGHSIFDTVYEIECQGHSLNEHIYIANDGEFRATQCTLRLKENPDKVKIVEFSFAQFGSEHKNKLVMISRDITKKIEKEKLFTMHTRQAQMGEMISMIAHQWRQPLAIVNAITSQMRLKAMIRDDNDTELIENLMKIEQQSSHLSQTISDYRDFFRPDKPKEHFSVSSLIEHALNLIDHTLKTHSIHIENIHFDNLILHTFRNEVLQVLIVLLKNALDAFVENKIKGGEITIGIRPEGKYCVITIRDNAGGIQKEVMNKLFSPYFTTKNESYGTGLGLYMSRMIIEEHCDGSIEVSSEDDTTTFTVKLPYEDMK